MAPEMIKKRAYSFSVDLWAIGIILYRLLFGKLPFNSGREISYPDNIIVSNNAKDLIENLLAINPSIKIPLIILFATIRT